MFEYLKGCTKAFEEKENFMDSLVAKMKENPEEFKADGYSLTHSSGLTVWVANGLTFYEVKSPRVKLSLFEKIRFKIAYRNWCSWNLWSKGCDE